MFGGAGREYAELRHEARDVRRRSRSRRAGTRRNNPYALFRDPVTVEEMLAVAARSSIR